ncbi:hypothetical protein M0R36_10995 [bacterium]|nr:hypothetical protein [bacterium]
MRTISFYEGFKDLKIGMVKWTLETNERYFTHRIDTIKKGIGEALKDIADIRYNLSRLDIGRADDNIKLLEKNLKILLDDDIERIMNHME